MGNLFIVEYGYGKTYNELQKVVSSDNEDGDHFGTGIDIDGNYAVVGANVEDGAGSDRGAAYVFYYNGSTWVEQAKLTILNPEDDDLLGWSVSISGDVIVLGAYQASAGGIWRGAAYVYEKPLNGWQDATENAILTASNAGDNDFFGNSVAIEENVIVVGANGVQGLGNNRGAAYVFEKSGANWVTATEDAILSASDGGNNDYLGRSVKISNDVIIVGASGHNSNQGAIYVYEKPTAGWISSTETAKLVSSDGVNGDSFGYNIDIENDVIVGGAFLKNGVGTNRGSAYVFHRSAGGWINSTEDAILSASDSEDGDSFGTYVSVKNDIIVVTAYLEDGAGTDRGAAYIYEKSGNNWTSMSETTKYLASNTSDDDQLGLGLGMNDYFISVGAWKSDGAGTDRGAAYFIEIFDSPSVVSIDADNITQNGVRLLADINDNNSSTTVSFYYGTSSGNYSSNTFASGSPIAAKSGVSSVSLDVSGLSPRKTYYYQVVAVNAYGTTTSSEGSFETLHGEDSDLDGISDEIEDTGPNNGDSNYDGIDDAVQSNIGTFNLNGFDITLVEMNSQRLIEVGEYAVANETGWVMPYGAIKFKVLGSASNIKIYYHGIRDMNGYSYRKLRSNDSWFSMGGVSFGSEFLNGSRVATAEFSLNDGGIEDYDGVVNGIIYDPGGPAFAGSTSSIPSLNFRWLSIFIIIILGLYYYKKMIY